ncbi:MAG: hypothetical protein EVG15_09715 [Candidatus Acididesulfobacter diazotrophicus]|jgi:hypothetical protein|uniref:Uncharacterized protein n=1 Tax=Candidatus Acididesulfobacter diazotrophicus TaxID=2597226 RepID=A0A519BKE0_9DELT|nr:MAG: hypothetical protein EVG15_09715 [Candidatus Acididesulfobacter diazotrophicus]
MLDLKIDLDKIISDFHKEILSNTDLSLFFYDVIALEPSLKEKMLLLLNSLFDTLGEKTIEDFQPIIKEIGENYCQLGTPLSTLTLGLDFIFKALSKKQMLKLTDIYTSSSYINKQKKTKN